MRRLGIVHVRPGVGPPAGREAPPLLAPIPGNSVLGAAQPQRIKLDTDPSFGKPRPRPVDSFNIIAAPASGTTSDLIGGSASAVFPPIPVGFRAFLYSIQPYIEGSSGPILSARIPGAGVTITWSLLVNEQPDPSYGAVTNLLGPWEHVSPVPLAELPEGTTIRVTVTNTDPNGLYRYLGVRLRGRLVQWKDAAP